MRRTKVYQLSLLLLAVLAGSTLSAQQLLHYWNFNNNATEASLLAPSQSSIPGASIVHLPGGLSAIDISGGTGQNFNVANLNARNGDPSGTHLRFNNPIGGALVFSLPSTGYEHIVVQFATRRSGSGAGIQYWSYTTDGTSYTAFDTLTVTDGNPVLETLDFSAIAAAGNNPDFKIKVTFAAGSGGSVGNNRFDNFTAEGSPAGSGDILPPTTVFDPANAAVNIAPGINPTISFNEPVRLVSNSPITASNAASLVELRLNNAAGAPVSFSTGFANNTITIIPAAPLQPNQQYYVALLGNTVEDHSDNAIAATQSVQFTTQPVQTEFSAGDMVFVAYRMNANNTEDEIALLTFKDILPGTFIRITDAKYTSNAQPQCDGGIVWTAPANECITAGSIISIHTDAMTANKGTVTGSGFGLSSGGDQVIVYTGTAANPNYITALTSNNWVVANTACGGSESMKPPALSDGQSSVNLSTAPGNLAGNSVNAYYNGTQTGTAATLRAAILDPSNWIAVPGGTAPQVWPAYNFPGPPQVTAALIPAANKIRLVFNSHLDPGSATAIAHYTGISGLATASLSSGSIADTVTLTYSLPFVPGNTYTLTVEHIANSNGEQMVCPYTFTFTYATSVSLGSSFIVAEENAGTLSLVLHVTHPSAGSVDLEVLGAPYATADTNDFVLASHTISLSDSTTQVLIPVAITDDTLREQAAEYLAIALRNPSGCSIEGDTLATIYIRDNDRVAPVPTKDIELDYIGSFDPSGSSNSTCEVVAYDSASRRLVTSSAISSRLEIVDFSNPATLTTLHSVDVSSYGGITSVAVKDGIIAVASPNADDMLEGSVLFFDMDGNFIKQVTVGVLPDMVTFSPNGRYVLTANEGQPNADYSIDPEGSVSIIDISGGIAGLSQAQVSTLNFTSFNSQEAALVAAGVRKTKASSTLSQDLEPEYITISSDNSKAWVTLQENNAIATIDLQHKTVSDIWPLGTKNMYAAGNGFDASDNNDAILIANWPVHSYYIPDAIAGFTAGDRQYLVTANEGDEKEYDGLNERTTVGAANYILDPAAFPQAALLKKSYNLGRMRVTNLDGDTDGDGDYDRIHALGSRSFSVWDADTKTLVYDSGDDFELYTATDTAIRALFNSDHEENAFKSRSRSKGPEPEGVTTGTLSGKHYAFVTLERVGGVMVYDVTDPASARLVDYKNSRSTSAYAGDHGPECLVFIPGAKSPDGNNYLVVANEISGTLSVFEVQDNNGTGTSVSSPGRRYKTFNVFPNPADGIAYFNRAADIEVYDMSGKMVHKAAHALTLNVRSYAPGMYVIRTAEGASVRLVVNR